MWLLVFVPVFSAACSGIKPSKSAGTSDALSAHPFASTIHPLVRQHCAGCHGDNGPNAPLFAVADAKAAEEAAMAASLLNHMSPEHSKFVEILSMKKHHCWSGQCANDAAEMTRAIEQWIDLIKRLGQQFDERSAGMDASLAYSRTLHPIVLKRCAQCHGDSQIQSPFFAVSDVKQSMAMLADTGRVDFKNPEKSRIVVRVRDERHQCWTKSCADDAKVIQSAIVEWVALMANNNTKSGRTTSELTISQAKKRMAQSEEGVILLEAEDAQLSGRFRIASDSRASQGKFITSLPIPLHPLDGATRNASVSICSGGKMQVFDDSRLSISEQSRHPAYTGHRKYLVPVNLKIVKADGSDLLDDKFRPLTIANVLYLPPQNATYEQMQDTSNLPADFFAPPYYAPSDDTLATIIRDDQKEDFIIPAVLNLLYAKGLYDEYKDLITNASNVDTYVRYELVRGINGGDPRFGSISITRTSFDPTTFKLVKGSSYNLFGNVSVDPNDMVLRNSSPYFEALPLNDRTPGAARFQVAIREEGYYTFWGRFGNGNRVAVRMLDKQGQALPWFNTSNESRENGECYLPNASNGGFKWVSIFNGTGDTMRNIWKLSPGSYTLEVGETNVQAQLDLIGLADVKTRPDFNPEKNAIDERFISDPRPLVLTWDISKLVGKTAYLEMEVKDFSQYAYRFRNPRIISPHTNVRIKGLRVLVNGRTTSTDETFAKIDRVMGKDSKIIQYSGLISLKDKGAKFDRFSVSFEEITATQADPTIVKPDTPLPATERECLAFDHFQTSVMPLFKHIRLVEYDSYNRFVGGDWPVDDRERVVANPRLYTCTGCHNSGHLLFKMTAFNDRDLCKQALSRVDFENFDRSILLRGVNGMWGHPKLHFIEDVPYSNGQYQTWTVNGQTVQTADDRPKYKNTFLGKVATYSQNEIESLIAEESNAGRIETLMQHVGEPKQVKVHVDSKGVPIKTGSTYTFDHINPLDPFFNEPNFSTFFRTGSGNEDWESLRARYRAIIIDWIKREKAEYEK